MPKHQPLLPGFDLKEQRSFGGATLKSHPKTQRALPLDRPIHLIMRSKYAVGPRSFRQPHLAEKVFHIIKRQCERFNVRLYEYGNGGNHIHLMLIPRSRRGYKGFIRAISGLIARATLKAEKSRPKRLRFWDARPYSRLVTWGRDFQQLKQYLVQNTLEAFGFIEPHPRGKGVGFDRQWKVRSEASG